MPRISATIPKKTIEDLKSISEKTNEPFSKVIRKIIHLGLLSYSNPNIESHNKIPSEFDFKNREYLLRLLNICSEILRKSHNEPSELPGKNVDSILLEIQTQAESLIENKTKEAYLKKSTICD